jgi:hypothetical protein
MITRIFIRDVLIFITGVWFFEFHLDYKLPAENNLLLFFVGIPIIWATLTQLWTSYSYGESKNRLMTMASHFLTVLILFSTVFLISAVLNTIGESLDTIGLIMFHVVGWTVIVGMIIYDIVDISRQ